MMPIYMLIKTLPREEAAVCWKNVGIRRIKRPKESMFALYSHTQK